MKRRYRQKSLGRLDKAKGWRSVGRLLRLRAMGMTLASFPAGGSYDHPHSHAGQEEVYILLSGRGEMAVDGRVLRLKPGDAVVVQPAAHRALRSGGRNGSTWLMVGATPGAYRQNDWTEHEEPAFPLRVRRSRSAKTRRGSKAGGPAKKNRGSRTRKATRTRTASRNRRSAKSRR